MRGGNAGVDGLSQWQRRRFGKTFLAGDLPKTQVGAYSAFVRNARRRAFRDMPTTPRTWRHADTGSYSACL